MTECSYFPKITLPTRLTARSGTLIDNIYVKLSEQSISATSGIFTSKLSDHQPYFLIFENMLKREKPPKFVKIYKETPDAINNLCQEINDANITAKLDCSESADPDSNYNILNDLILTAKDKHLPTKIVKFHKHKH